MHIVLVLVLLAGLVFALSGFIADHWIACTTLLAVSIGALLVRTHSARKQKLEIERIQRDERDAKRARLGAVHDAPTVERLMRGQLAKGDTEAMVLEARGEPAAREERNVASRKHATWKYGQVGTGRFTGRVIFEDGRVDRWVD